MANFTAAFSRIAKNEGGYQANPSDNGNYNSLGLLVGTNRGVSAKLYETWIGRPPSVADMKGITSAIAANIFRQRYWNKIYGDSISSQPVAEILFDGVINHGQGVKLAQEVLGVTADNSFGQQTFNALENMNPAKFYNAYKERRRKYYYQLAENNPSQLVFLNGWLKRLEKFNDFPSSGGGVSAGGVVLGVLAIVAYQNRKALLRNAR